MSRDVLEDKHLRGSVFLVGPGGEREFEPIDLEQLCFVARGTITLTIDATNTILIEDELLRIGRRKPLRIHNRDTSPAKFLLLTLPPPRIEYLPLGFHPGDLAETGSSRPAPRNGQPPA